MSKTTLDFLIEKYGHRVDFPLPIIDTDDETIQNQLNLVDKKINQSKNFGLLFICIGVVMIAHSIFKLTSEITAIGIFQMGTYIFFFIAGLVRFNQVAELKRKKVILETILFVNNS